MNQPEDYELDQLAESGSECDASSQSELGKEAALKRMKKLANKIYDTTPGIEKSKLKQIHLRALVVTVMCANSAP